MNYKQVRRYLFMSEYDKTSYDITSMKNLKLYLGFLLFAIFNGFVWVNLFEDYKEDVI